MNKIKQQKISLSSNSTKLEENNFSNINRESKCYEKPNPPIIKEENTNEIFNFTNKENSENNMKKRNIPQNNNNSMENRNIEAEKYNK